MRRDHRARRLPPECSEAGFTLVELMIATSLYMLVTAGLITGFTSLLRNYEAVKQYATHHADEMRISDYLALDFRRAIAVPSVAENDVTIWLPSYYDGTTPPQPRTPSLDGKGGVYYGASGSKVVVHYYLSNSSIYRQEDAKAPVKLADHVADFVFTATDLGKVITTKVVFNPTFKSSGASSETTNATAFYNTTLLRNNRGVY